MSSALANVAWEPCFMEARQDRDLEAYARRRMGLPNAAVRYFAAAPWVARTAIDLHPEFGLLVHLNQQTADLIGIVVSQENSCRFCFAAVRAVLWFQGMDRQRVQRIEQEVARHDLPLPVRAAIDYARSQSRTGPAGAHAAWAALRHAGVGAVEARRSRSRWPSTTLQQAAYGVCDPADAAGACTRAVADASAAPADRASGEQPPLARAAAANAPLAPDLPYARSSRPTPIRRSRRRWRAR